MRPVPVVRLFATALALLGAVGCGKEIGDDCSLNVDCDPNGGRICDLQSPGGYCTVQGCDVDTCPDDSVCVSFYIASFEGLDCDPRASNTTCSADEVCTLQGQCVPRSSEVRYCMATCESNDDCREDYECRDETLMQAHGGQPVTREGEGLGSNLQRFCATAPLGT